MKNKIKDYILITFGAMLIAIGVYFFKVPNGFATGGVSGIATVLDEIIKVEWLTAGLLIIMLNLALLLVGFIFVNKQFGLKTVYCTIAYSALTYLLEWIYPLENRTLTEEPLLELVFAIVITAVGAALLFNADASSGGTDIIAMILKKYTHINVGMALLVADSIVAISAFWVFGVEIGLFSLLGLFSKSFLVDGVIENLNLCKYFTIITEKPDDICEYIIKEMHHGVTLQNAEGGFSHHKKKVILAVCRRSEAHLLKRKIKNIDPTSFVMITNSSEIIGRGFRNP